MGLCQGQRMMSVTMFLFACRFTFAQYTSSDQYSRATIYTCYIVHTVAAKYTDVKTRIEMSKLVLWSEPDLDDSARTGEHLRRFQ